MGGIERHMLPSENNVRDGSELCQSCGLCCTGVVCDLAIISPDEDKVFLNAVGSEIQLVPFGENFAFKLPCPVYESNCTKYSIRPMDCRDFQCKLLQQFRAGEKTRDQAMEIIAVSLNLLQKLLVQYSCVHANERRLTRKEIYSL